MTRMPRPRKIRRWLASLGLVLGVAYAGVYAHESLHVSPADRLIVFEEGRTLAWRLIREPPEPAARVLLIHGAPADSGSWNMFESRGAHLAGNCEIFAVDRPGYGQSGPQSDLSLEAQTRSLAPLLDDCTIVVGHSYGGPVALRAAIEFPDRIAGVVLVAGACDATMDDAQWARRLLELVPRIVPESWAQANRELLALTDENDAMTELLDRVTCPVTIIHGTWDPVCPHDGTIRYLQGMLANAEVSVDSLPRAGHNLHLSHPERVAMAIAAMVDASTEPVPEAVKPNTPSR